jgi:FkbM family methyltransferase
MSLKTMIPKPVRDVLRRPYYAIRRAPADIADALLERRLRARFREDGLGVRVRIVDDFAPAIHLSALQQALYFSHEPEIRAEVRHFMGVVREVVREGPCRFLDIGASHGLLSLAAVHAGGEAARVLALEPSPRAFANLRWHFDRLPPGQAEALQVAAGAHEGTLDLYPADATTPMMYCTPQPHTQATPTTVPVTTLDALRDRQGFRPTVLKVDVEGFELEVLRGAGRVLAEDRPALFLEIHGAMLADRGLAPRAVLDLVREAGYRIEAVDGPTDEQIARIEAGFTRRFLCRPSRTS